jgi:hypothetical protein
MLDFQFGKPGIRPSHQHLPRFIVTRCALVWLFPCAGCDGTKSDFISYVFVNSGILAASIAPTVVIMPLLMVRCCSPQIRRWVELQAAPALLAPLHSSAGMHAGSV